MFIDECHATGFLGETGRGTEEAVGVSGRCHIINSTLGKALGGAAGKLVITECEVDLVLSLIYRFVRNLTHDM